MRNAIRLGLVGVTGLTFGTAAPTPDVGLPNLVFEVATDSLEDVAVAVYSPWRGVIYYNPTLERRLGPDLTAFFQAHEFGHLYYHHTRAGATTVPGPRGTEVILLSHELQADCYATKKLALTHRAAVQAAVQFFNRMDEVHYDAEHPSGAVRAANILACLP